MISFFNSEKILRLTKEHNRAEVIADNILNGDIQIFPKLSNVKVNNFSDLFDLKFDKAQSTYALYVYALYPISYLLNAFELKRNRAYLDAALLYSVVFLKWETSEGRQIEKKREGILFGDHAVSNRTQALCYLCCCLKSENIEIPDVVKESLIRNGRYLSDNKNYSHYNHGLMMDLALLGLLNTFKGLGFSYPNEFKTNLISRLKHSLTRDLTEDGVHVENSPGYHFWILGFLGKIISPLQFLDEDIYLNATLAYSKATEYAYFITRSDGSVPTIGDTHSGVKYTFKTGLKSKWFKHSNTVIFRCLESDAWAILISGYKTHVHKHSDNGSFNLYYKGYDIFLDPGFLNYERNEYSSLIKTAAYHNTVKPVGFDQVINRVELQQEEVNYFSNLSDSKVDFFSSFCDLEYSLVSVSDYSVGKIERLVIWLKPDIFILYDKAVDFDGAIEQNFHINPMLELQCCDDVVSISDKIENNVLCRLVRPRSDFYNSSMEVRKAFSSNGFDSTIESDIVSVGSGNRFCLTVVVLGDLNIGSVELNCPDDLHLSFRFGFYKKVISLEAIRRQVKN